MLILAIVRGAERERNSSWAGHKAVREADREPMLGRVGSPSGLLLGCAIVLEIKDRRL
jgi:hypothetical protein